MEPQHIEIINRLKKDGADVRINLNFSNILLHSSPKSDELMRSALSSVIKAVEEGIPLETGLDGFRVFSESERANLASLDPDSPRRQMFDFLEEYLKLERSLKVDFDINKPDSPELKPTKDQLLKLTNKYKKIKPSLKPRIKIK